jgi:hypothetical protein
VTVIGFLIGMAIFLLLGYFCLMLLFFPYFWFKAYLELEERKAKESRDAYQKKMQEFANREGTDTGWLTPYKDSKRKGIRGMTENELVVESLEWLFSWGIFLALEAFWVYSLYNGFELVMQNVGDFLDENFFAE